MKKYFVDASFLIALLKKDDPNHQTAKIIAKKIGANNKLYINFLCLSEAVTVLSIRVGKIQAEEVLDRYLSRELLEIEIDSATKQNAIDIFQSQKSKNLPFFDCVHFATMKDAKISKVLGFDIHFKKFGFDLINK